MLKTQQQFPMWFWFIPILWAAMWLGVIGLDADMIWYDEYWSVWSAGGAHYGPAALGEIWERAVSDPSQPPTYYFMLAGWGKLTGWTPLAMRYMSLLMGVLSVAWTYRLGRDIFSHRAGLLAALVLGTSAFFAYYLHELRLYTLLVLFSTMTISLYWRLIHSRRPHGFTQALFVLSVAGVCYSHYLALPTLPALALYHLLFVRKDRTWWRIPILMGAGVLIFLPWLGYAIGAVDRFAGGGGRTDTAVNSVQALAYLVYALSNGTVILAGVLLAAIPNLPTRRGDACITPSPNMGSTFLWFVALLILIQALIMNWAVSVLTHTRYLMALWPLLSILMAWGLLRLRFSRWMSVAFMAVWVVFGVYNSLTPDFTAALFRDVHTRFFRPNLPIDDLGDFIHQHAAAGDVVAMHAPNAPWAISGGFDYALHGIPAVYRIMDELGGEPGTDDYIQRMRQFIGQAGRVWLAVETGLTGQRLADFKALLEPDYMDCGQVLDLGDIITGLYARNEILCLTHQDDTRARFGQGVTLRNAAFSEITGQTLAIYTTWGTEKGVPPETYSVGMYIFNAAGEFVLQGQDFSLPMGDFAYTITRIPVDGLQSGDYAITAAVYAWRSGERLLVNGEDSVMLGQFSVP